ncbi:hypothetical protein AIT98_004587 [Salmonella enterica subsp. indica]|uniref:hypothetical protein n=1 Tax=Salmonella enterica TaxID=28901 RepID=UPI00111C8792|nr:hypothetical protein [Salmonella enterica]HBC0060693.1 hypothetical protein [Salmonella enterica]HCL5302022.1 hypothetical protein [Salmonella enterica]
MYLAWALPLLFPFLRQIGSEARIPGADPIIFAFLRNPLKFTALVAPDNEDDLSKEKDKLISH